jgi:phage terminase large subunit GpA-like protein
MRSSPSITRRTWYEGLEPDPDYSVSEWADRFRMLTPRSAAARGLYQTDKTPYARAIMDALSADATYQRVVFMKASQVGATEIGNNWIGYTIHQEPCACLILQPTIELAKKHSRLRIVPMCADTPELAELVRATSSRDAMNTALMKEFPGGSLVLTGANSAAGLRMLPFRKLFGDEIDAYPMNLEKEGDPLDLAERGMKTFPNRKAFLVSTPLIAGESRIEYEFSLTDQNFYHVPCPDCGHMQDLYFEHKGRYGLVWPRGKPEQAHYVCQECGSCIEEYKKTEMLAAGEWRARKPENANPRVIGFHLNALYSPIGWYSWGEIAQAFLKAKDRPLKLQVVVNQVFGQTFEDRGEAPDWEALYRRRESYRFETVPRGGLVLVAGADVQKDRIEAEVVAYGEDLESWSIGYYTFPGDTETKEPWKGLERLLIKTFTHETGAVLRIRMLAVDTGYATQTVYRWVRRQDAQRVIAIKGRGQLMSLIARPTKVDVDLGGKVLKRGLRLWKVGTDVARRELYAWLRHKAPLETDDQALEYPPGFVHFPQYGPEWFEQLTSHEAKLSVIQGHRRYVWHKRRERDEALDCRIYSRAAACVVGLDRYTPKAWGLLRQRLEASKNAEQAAPKARERPARRDREPPRPRYGRD